jgi:Ca2+:H+ antiporter
LAISITIIEVALIISLMTAGGKETSHLARDTVFAAVMLILNGVLGLSLLVGSVKFHEQFFARTSANSLLVSLIAILVLTLFFLILRPDKLSCLYAKLIFLFP